MRVLHVDCGLQMRGGQWQVLRLVEAQRAAGVEATLMVPSRAALMAHAAGSMAFTPWALWRESLRHDVIHVHDARAHTWAAVCGIKPLVVSRRVAFAVGRGWLSRWKYSRPQRFIAISRAVAATLEEAVVARERIAIVGDGVVAFDWQSDGTGGAIAPQTDDPAKGSDLVRESGVAVRFSRDLWRDLRHASCLVYISRQEGLGSAILLAMAAGVPVVASRVGGIPEIVEHEVTGLLLDNAASAIASALTRLENDAPLRTRLIENARQLVRGQFTMSHIAAGTLRVYEELRR